MNIYYLNNLIDGVRLSDERIIELVNAVIEYINRANVRNYDEYMGLVYEIGLNLPMQDREEKEAARAVLKLLLNNREAIMGLCKQGRRINIVVTQDRLIAIVF